MKRQSSFSENLNTKTKFLTQLKNKLNLTKSILTYDSLNAWQKRSSKSPVMNQRKKLSHQSVIQVYDASAQRDLTI